MGEIKIGTVERLRILEREPRGNVQQCQWCGEFIWGLWVWQARSSSSQNEYLVCIECANNKG